jgi:hypothetical protein
MCLARSLARPLLLALCGVKNSFRSACSCLISIAPCTLPVVGCTVRRACSLQPWPWPSAVQACLIGKSSALQGNLQGCSYHRMWMNLRFMYC